MATGRHEVLLDTRILDEYRRVLERQEFSFDLTAVRSLLAALDASSMEVDAAPVELRLVDPEDLPFLEVAVAGRAHALVTGNGRHFVPIEGAHSKHVVSPREGLELLNR